MRNYILKSFIRAFFTMLIVMSVLFLILRLGPLDPAQYILGELATAEALKNVREILGLDKPIYVQYLSFLKHLIQGNFGSSFLNDLPVLSQLLKVLPYTIELVLGGIVLGIFFGVPPGIVSALKPNSLLDQFIRLLTLAGISIPIFVAGIVLITVFSVKLDLLPAIGEGTSGGLKSHLLHLILPSISCGLLMMASVARLTRASLLEVLNKEFIVTARRAGWRV